MMKKLAMVCMAVGLAFGAASCAKLGLVQVEGKRISIQKAINFENGSDKITEGFDVLDAVAELMNSSKMANSRVRLEGNTDNTGDSQVNMDLSARRAASVKSYLVSKGVAENRLEVKGNGSTSPIASNDTEDGRALNRRVDFVVLD